LARLAAGAETVDRADPVHGARYSEPYERMTGL